MTMPTTDWRERAVTRSLDRARSRAEERLQRLMAAAEEIMSEGGDVTVQEVVSRAGQSLRTFYQHFAGKHELMLALLELGCEELAAEVEARSAEHDDPVDALRAAVAALHAASRPQRSRRRLALSQFSAQLLHTDPAAFQAVQQRLVRLLEDLVARAAPQAPSPLRTAALVINIVQGTVRRDELLAAQGLDPLTADEAWASVAGLLSLTRAG